MLVIASAESGDNNGRITYVSSKNSASMSLYLLVVHMHHIIRRSTELRYAALAKLGDEYVVELHFMFKDGLGMM